LKSPIKQAKLRRGMGVNLASNVSKIIYDKQTNDPVRDIH
jgi:hypothetical protein